MKHKKLLFYSIESLIGIIIFAALYYTYTHTAVETAQCKDDYCIWNASLVTVLDEQYGDRYAFMNLKKAKPGRLRILIMGDSVVYGQTPQVIAVERELNKRVPFRFQDGQINDVNVINGGRGGSTIKSSLERYQALRDAGNQFDIVFLFTGWNEHWYGLDNPCSRAGCYHDHTLLRWLYDASSSEDRLVNNLARDALGDVQERNLHYCEDKYHADPVAFMQGFDHMNTSIYRVSLDEYRHYLRQFRDLTEQDASILVLVTAPDGLTDGIVPRISSKDCTLIDPESYYAVHELYVGALRNFSKANSLPLLDLQQNFRKNPNYREAYFDNASFDPIHPGMSGRWFANLEYERMILEILHLSTNTTFP
jgi:hypothetical protein